MLLESTNSEDSAQRIRNWEMFSDAVEHPGDAHVGGAQLCVWASLPKGKLQNPHPQNPPWVLRNRLTHSPFQTLMPERFLPPPGPEQSLVTHFPPGCRFVRRFPYHQESTKGHLSVCCRPLAPVITTEQRPAASRGEGSPCPDLCLLYCAVPLCPGSCFPTSLPSCSSELMRFCCT